MAKYLLWASLTLNLLLATAVYLELGDDFVHAPPPSKVAQHRMLAPIDVNPAWIKSGTPKFLSAYTSELDSVGVSTGLWSCEGPTVFEWVYGTDETIHVLEGGAEIEYLGTHLSIGPGDTVFFRSGTKATWTVKDRIYKSWVLHDPGRLARWYRRITGN